MVKHQLFNDFNSILSDLTSTSGTIRNKQVNLQCFEALDAYFFKIGFLMRFVFFSVHVFHKVLMRPAALFLSLHAF